MGVGEGGIQVQVPSASAGHAAHAGVGSASAGCLSGLKMVPSLFYTIVL